MYEIVKQYAGALMVGASALMLLILIFVAWPVVDAAGNTHRGSVMESVGQTVDKSMTKRIIDWGSHADGNALNAHADRDRPTAKTKKHAVEQVTISLSDLFLIKDCDGREWSSSTKDWRKGGDIKSGVVDIQSVKNSRGVEVLSSVWDRNAQRFTFPEPDTMLVTLRVMDYDNVEATYQIPVAVDMQYPNP